MIAQIQQLNAQQIRGLTIAERLQLIILIAQEMTIEPSNGKRNITELRGLGKEIWQVVDAQPYVDELRQTWEAQTLR